MPRSTSTTLFAGLCVGLFVLSVYLLIGSSDLLHNGDTDLRYQTTQALVDHHRLWLADPMYYDTRVATGLGDHLYAFYAPGQTLLMVPLYVAGKFIAHHFSLPYDISTLYATRSLDLWLGALLSVIFFAFAISLNYRVLTAAVLTLIFALASVALPDAQSALEQTQVDFFLLVSVLAVWQYRRGAFIARWWLVVAGLAAGAGFATRYDFALFLPVVGLFPLLCEWRAGLRTRVLSDAALYVLGTVPGIVLVIFWNIARFGNPLTTGLQEQTIGEPFLQGLLGLILSPGKGILWYLPLIFLLPLAARRFYRAHPSLAILFAVLILLPMVFYANILYWHGDPAWGPRYLYTAVPYLVLPLGIVLETWRQWGNKIRALFLVVVGISFLIQVEAISVTQWRFWYRLQVAESHTSQQFQWGASHYHYYWNVAQSPLLVQADDVYQVIRLQFGDERYRLQDKPNDPLVHSNPAFDYPVNELQFWWLDTRHPLFGAHTRDAIAGTLAILALLSLIALSRTVRDPSRQEGSDRALELPGIGAPGR